MEMKKFDPNGVGLENAGIFGLPFSPEEAQVVLLPAPWGVTVSYGGGTQDGPKAILDASPQIDYYHESYGADSWKIGIAMLPVGDWNNAYEQGLNMREKAKAHIEALESGENTDAVPQEVNDACDLYFGYHRTP
jgi:agmatinase